MTNAPDNNEYQKKLNKVNLNRLTRCASNMLKPNESLTIAQIVTQAILEGMILLRAEEKEKINPKPEPITQTPQTLETKLDSISENPIIRARVKVLNGYSQFRRTEIERMERNGDTDNRFYKDFVAEVSRLTDIP